MREDTTRAVGVGATLVGNAAADDVVGSGLTLGAELLAGAFSCGEAGGGLVPHPLAHTAAITTAAADPKRHVVRPPRFDPPIDSTWHPRVARNRVVRPGTGSGVLPAEHPP